MRIFAGVVRFTCFDGVDVAEVGSRIFLEPPLVHEAAAQPQGLLPEPFGDIALKMASGVGGARNWRPEAGVARCAGVLRCAGV